MGHSEVFLFILQPLWGGLLPSELLEGRAVSVAAAAAHELHGTPALPPISWHSQVERFSRL